jgi:hypothetical protein
MTYRRSPRKNWLPLHQFDARWRDLDGEKEKENGFRRRRFRGVLGRQINKKNDCKAATSQDFVRNQAVFLRWLLWGGFVSSFLKYRENT